MTTGQLIILDYVVALLSAAAWFATGVAAALRRARPALVLLAAAGLATLTRVATVAVLASRGWWFVQEKVVLGLPMVVAAGLAAVLIAGPRLHKARLAGGETVPAGSVVALLTAAYAAFAGLVVTLLVGYPLTWGVALITVSLVGAAALLTVRAVAEKPADAAELNQATGAHAGFSRRRFLRLAAGGVMLGAGSAGFGLLFRPAPSAATGGGPGSSPHSRAALSVTDLRGPRTPAPGGTRPQYVLTAQTGTVRLSSGQELDAWTFDGQIPGPAIKATEGDLIEVTLRNSDIKDGVTLHWHGYDVPCGEDGAPDVTQHAVAPGEEFVYRFRADQVGTYWYHTHQASHRGVRRGLYGSLVVTPRRALRPDEGPVPELDLVLPLHTFAGTVVIGNSDELTERTAPTGALMRLRLINTDSDPHWFALAGTPFRVAAVDGRDLNEPDEVSDVRLRLPAGGRYDLVFVMPDAPVALMLGNNSGAGLRLRPDGSAVAEPSVDDTAGWPELDLLHYGNPATLPFDAGNADRNFTMVLDRGVATVDGGPTYAHTVNGRGHPSIPDQLVAEGDLVRFTVINRSLETHPWHLHGHPVLILTRNGTPSSGSPLWMDTFDVRPGEVWEVAFEATNSGIWMNHCHNLPHAHQGMMLRLRYDGVTTPFGDAHAAHGGVTNPRPR
ncbi:MAG TPA: multicopper oxidase family protein [Jiangellaceae bacterium]